MTHTFETTLGGATIRGESRGSGPALVLLHAGVADQRMWQPQLAALSQTHRVITYDRRGHGLTETRDEPFRHLDDLAAVLQHLNIQSATFCGCSQGARIAIDFALAHPDQTDALILVAACWSGAPWQEITQREKDLVKQIDAAEQAEDINAVNALEAHLWLDGPAADAGRAAQHHRKLFLDMNLIALNHPELTQEVESDDANLQAIHCPVLLLNGDLDLEVVRQFHQTLKDNIPQSVSHELIATAHLPSLEQPDDFNRRVQDFIAGQF